jgi:hypothetical protein
VHQPDPHRVAEVEPSPRPRNAIADSFFAVDPTWLAPPVLGGIPKAARYPWYLPIEPAQPGVAADQVRLGDLEVRAASVVGPDHRCEEPAVARQDAYRLGRDAKGAHLVVAVADGLSSAARSDVGATVAVRAGVDLVRRELDSGVVPEELDFVTVFKRIAGHVAGSARQLRCSVEEVLTALVIVIVPSTPNGPDGGRTVCTAAIADVSAWLREDSGWQRLAGVSKHGMDRNALKEFLPHYPESVVLRGSRVPAGATLAVVTDGIGDALTDLPDGADWFAQRWRQPTNLNSFLLDVSYEAPGYLDDRTAVVVWCGQEPR